MRELRLIWRPICADCRARQVQQIRHHATSIIRKPSGQGLADRFQLPSTPARTRFAPSPTGYLHLGSLRTALYNYLLAKATGGQFIIRVEDTDQTRLVADAEQRLYDDLRWAGLTWDEGPEIGGQYGPYKQSERLGLYRKYADLLLQQDRAFRCFCSREALEFQQQTNDSAGAASAYPGTCLHVSRAESDERAAKGEPYTIRFKSAAKPIEAPDLVYGKYKKAHREDDFIIIKSDGYPTYHFANVVDDHFMEITHVIRGAEWLISTPKHVELYNALGWEPPKFAHVGLLVDKERHKLSKRDLANIGISAYRDQGTLPPALLNFSALLGWNPNSTGKSNKQGFMSLEEMVDNFSLRFTRGDIVVDQGKLPFFQKKHYTHLLQDKSTSSPVLTKYVLEPMERALHHYEDARQNTSKARGSEDLERIKTLGDPLPLERVLSDQLNLHDYILKALNISRVSYENPSNSLESAKYMFWRIPDRALQQSLDVLWNEITSVTHEGNTQSFEKVLTLLIEDLSSVKESDWNENYLPRHVTSLANSIVVHEKSGKTMDVGGGYKFLRWALLNSMHGAQIVPLMVLLGKQETIERLSVAKTLAASALSERELSSDNPNEAIAPGTASPLVEAITLLVGGR